MQRHLDAKAIACLHKFPSISSVRNHHLARQWSQCGPHLRVGRLDKASTQLGLSGLLWRVDVYISGRKHCFNLEGPLQTHTQLLKKIKIKNASYTMKIE